MGLKSSKVSAVILVRVGKGRHLTSEDSNQQIRAVFPKSYVIWLPLMYSVVKLTFRWASPCPLQCYTRLRS